MVQVCATVRGAVVENEGALGVHDPVHAVHEVLRGGTRAVTGKAVKLGGRDVVAEVAPAHAIRLECADVADLALVAA